MTFVQTSGQDPANQGAAMMFPAVLAGAQVQDWYERIEARYRLLEAARLRDGLLASGRLMSPGQRFVPTASSFTIGEIFTGENLRALLTAILASAAGGCAGNMPRSITRPGTRRTAGIRTARWDLTSRRTPTGIFHRRPFLTW
jgi:hypothetical protein